MIGKHADEQDSKMPGRLAPPGARFRRSPSLGMTVSTASTTASVSDEGCSPSSSPSSEDEWRWPDQDAVSSDSAIALRDERADDVGPLWPHDTQGTDSDLAALAARRECSADEDDIPAGSDASCQGDAKAVADDAVFEEDWRRGRGRGVGVFAANLSLQALEGLSLDDIRWSRFTEHGQVADDDEDAEALVADGCDERGRRVKVYSFDSYDSGVMMAAGEDAARTFLRRASTQSADEPPTYRYWRTPSVVVSDYSDDLSSSAAVGAVTLEEIEQFRSQYAARHDATDLSSSDVSRASSCSNLQYWGLSDRKASFCSSCSTLSGDEDLDSQLQAVQTRNKPSGWRKIKNIVSWTPFVQKYKNQQYDWVQLAGHQGNFKAGPTQGTILKKVCTDEEKAFRALMKDQLRPYVPEFVEKVTSNEGDYLHLQDLLSGFSKPCVMDCKMGLRTYLEEELTKARSNLKLRKDMYDKMVQVNPDEPTEDERRAGGVTKTRYMVFRETTSSTATLGFRIEGLKMSDGELSKDFKTTKERSQVMQYFRDFTRNYPHAVNRYITRLRAIRSTLEVSDFFRTHELIGSSLLFLHDDKKANIWLIDFAKSRELPKGISITHSKPWKEGNHEDGYLIGLTNLIDIFTELQEAQSAETPPDSATPSESSPSSSRSSAPGSPGSSPLDASPPTSPEDEAVVGLRLNLSRPGLYRKDTLVGQVSEDEAKEESPPPFSVQLELRPSDRDPDQDDQDVQHRPASPRGLQRFDQPTPVLPMPVHIKKTATVLALQTPAEAAALDRTELT